MNGGSPSPLTSREVYLVLRDVAQGTRRMNRARNQSRNESYHGVTPVKIDGWHLTPFNDYDTLLPQRF